MDQVIIRMMSDYKVETINDGMQEFFVEFHGPKDSKFLQPFVSFYFQLLFFVQFLVEIVLFYLVQLLMLLFNCLVVIFFNADELHLGSMSLCLTSKVLFPLSHVLFFSLVC